MNYIIDGYNLAFVTDTISQTLKKGDTEIAIKQLIHYVRSVVNKKNSKVIIVFDGPNDSQPKKLREGSVDILFSKKPQTADDIIRTFIRKTANKSKWTVVSSDNEIIFTAEDHGVNTMKSSQFKDLKIKQAKSKKSLGIENKSNPNNIDVNYWKEIFNSGKNNE